MYLVCDTMEAFDFLGVLRGPSTGLPMQLSIVSHGGPLGLVILKS